MMILKSEEKNMLNKIFNLTWFGKKSNSLRTFKHTYPPHLMDNNLGFSLVSVLIVVGIVGMTFAGTLSLITTQQKEGDAVKQQLAKASVKYALLQTLKNPDSCLCQFNSIPSTPLTINTDNAKPGEAGDEITFTKVTTGCGLNSEVIAQAGMNVGAGLKIQSVKVSEIMETPIPLEYSGNLVVTYSLNSLVYSVKPTSIPLILTIQTLTGSPTARGVHHCVLNTEWHDDLLALENDLVNVESTLTNQIDMANLEMDSRFSTTHDILTTRLENLDARITTNEENINNLVAAIANLGGGSPVINEVPEDEEEDEEEDEIIIQPDPNETCTCTVTPAGSPIGNVNAYRHYEFDRTVYALRIQKSSTGHCHECLGVIRYIRLQSGRDYFKGIYLFVRMAMPSCPSGYTHKEAPSPSPKCSRFQVTKRRNPNAPVSFTTSGSDCPPLVCKRLP